MNFFLTFHLCMVIFFVFILLLHCVCYEFIWMLAVGVFRSQGDTNVNEWINE